ncbi:E3 ubiquitin-protein ligase TRAIP-like [Panulirus ornatus]|uniref:E3 ubiquitin-protein ligase TRAIP-like n=1 Tax=Panulirus ornatus TaxID=150431 RepID=UPI003A8675E7
MRAGCVICGDLFISSADISATPCGHTFHSLCLIQWIERSKSCPQCRQKATEKSLVKLYFDTSGADATQLDPDTLQQQIDNLKFQIRLKEQEIRTLKESTATLTKQNRALKEEYKTVESQVKVKETTNLALKTQLQFMDRITKEAQKAKEEAKSLRGQLKVLQDVEGIVSGTSEDVEEMLVSYTGNHDGTRSLATFCSILKKELNKTVEDKKRFRDEASSLRNKIKEAKQKYTAAAAELNRLEQTNKNMQDDVLSLERENTSLRKKVNALEQAICSPSGDKTNSVLHRLIAESPAPADLKRHRTISSDSEDLSITPEVVHKMAHFEKTKDDKNDPLCIQLSPPSQQQSQLSAKTVLSCRNPLAVTVNVVPPTNIQHHDIFAKNKPCLKSLGASQKASSKVTSENDLIGYDGLGGHHKVDTFPKPRPAYLKKKTGVKVVTRGGSGVRVQSTTLKNFFVNVFDD